jgi:hypothetical protein
MDGSLPCLGILEATPEILRGLMCELNAEDARWRPAEDRFSVGEVLAHLSHTEAHCYGARLDRFLHDEHPVLEPYDPKEHLDVYRAADPEDAFDHFEEQRESNLERLRGLPASAASRRAHHKRVGEITLSEMLHEWALHDLGHIRQVAELARARKYFAGAGPFRDSYRLNP